MINDSGARDGAATAVPPNSRGVIALDPAACTVCMLCVRECPDWCITIEGHPETSVPEGGGRPRQTLVLDRFDLDYGLCMYCGICVEVCPYDALFWAPTRVAPGGSGALVAGEPRLADWLADVPR